MNSSLDSPAAAGQPLSMRSFIERSLHVLRREHPVAYFQLCAMLVPRELLLLLEGEEVPLLFTPGGVLLPATPTAPVVTLRTGRRTILDVIDARLTLQQAVAREAIVLQGAVDELALFHDALLLYVRGGVRCPSFPALLARFRRAEAGHFMATTRPMPGSSSSQ